MATPPQYPSTQWFTKTLSDMSNNIRDNQAKIDQAVVDLSRSDSERQRRRLTLFIDRYEANNARIRDRRDALIKEAESLGIDLG